MKAVPDQIERWVPGGLLTLGTDGFGRSDTREALRSHFEIDEAHIVYAVLYRLEQKAHFPKDRLIAARQELGIDPEKPYPPRS
jgi:pyruvate dehydrogenase E1 component